MQPGVATESRERTPLAGVTGAISTAARRYGDAVAEDVARVRRIPSLIARARAGWSAADRREADDAARSLVRVGAWLVALAMPGGLLLLPFLIGGPDRR